MQEEGHVALGLRRDSALEAFVGIGLGHVPAPVLEREGRIGDDAIKGIEHAVSGELRIADGIAGADVGIREAV